MTPTGNERLDSWKAIAFYLKRDIRTVQLWEKTQGLPIHRERHISLPSVFAYKSELDFWRDCRTIKAKRAEAPSNGAMPGSAGYGPANRVLPDTAELQASFPVPAFEARRHFGWATTRSSTVIAASLALCIALGWVGFRTQRHPNATSEPYASPFTSYPGNESTPSFSPDGTRVAFAWDGPEKGNLDIYVKLVGPGDPIRLTVNPAHDHDPVWSPNGSWIAFLRDLSDQARAILVIPALGGPERTIARTRIVKEASNPTEAPLLSWSPDGKYLFTLDAQDENMGPYAVARVSLETGEAKPVTFPGRKSLGELASAVSPDGHFLAFNRQISDIAMDLSIVPLSSRALPAGAPTTILSNVRMEGFAWTPDSQNIILFGEVNSKGGFWQAGVNGSRKLTHLAGLGSIPRRLKRMGKSRGITLAISQDGRRLIYSEGKFDVNIWRIQLTGDSKGKVLPSITSTRDEVQPEYSPDGRKIAFQSDRSGCEEVWVCNADASAPFQVTNFGTGFSGSPRWSPDSRQIVFDRLEAQNWAIYVVSSEGGQPVRISTNAGNNVTPLWSPDGRWIYFASDRTGRSEVWKLPITGGSEVQITRDGGATPALSVDGSSLYYTRSSGPSNVTLWSMPIGGGRETKILERLLFPRAYAVANHGIYFIAGQSISSAPFGDSLDRILRFASSLSTVENSRRSVWSKGMT